MSTAKSLLKEQEELDQKKRKSIEEWEKVIRSALPEDCVICHSIFSSKTEFSCIFTRRDQDLEALESLANNAKEQKLKITKLTKGMKKIEVTPTMELRATVSFYYNGNYCSNIYLKNFFSYLLNNSQ